MYQGTTPSVVYEVKNYDLTSASIFVSFKKGNEVITKTQPDVAASYSSASKISAVVCNLTQEETLKMKAGGWITQIRFIYASGQAFATNEKELEVKRVLYPEVISYGGDGS